MTIWDQKICSLLNKLEIKGYISALKLYCCAYNQFISNSRNIIFYNSNTVKPLLDKAFENLRAKFEDENETLSNNPARRMYYKYFTEHMSPDQILFDGNGNVDLFHLSSHIDNLKQREILDRGLAPLLYKADPRERTQESTPTP